MDSARLSASSTLRLFAGTFFSALLFCFGVGTLGLMFIPVAGTLLEPNSTYTPQLPLTQARTEPFIDINEIPLRQFFPPIPSFESNVTAPAQQDWIRIPSIDVNVPIAMSPTMNDNDVLSTLDSGAALYPNGVLPGHLGNTFISAHSTGEPWKGAYRFAFLRINEVQPNNIIHIDYKGTRYTYRVTGSELVTPTPGFTVASDGSEPTIALMACWPLWSTKQRMLVHGELTNITKLTQKPF